LIDALLGERQGDVMAEISVLANPNDDDNDFIFYSKNLSVQNGYALLCSTSIKQTRKISVHSDCHCPLKSPTKFHAPNKWMSLSFVVHVSQLIISLYVQKLTFYSQAPEEIT
jgi:hypothetical protein